MVSLQPHASLSLRHSVTGTNTVSWSVDNRIAVTSQDIVYVLSLNRPLESSNMLPASVSIASIPKLSKLTNDGGLRVLIKCLDVIDRSIFLDPALGNVELPTDIFTSTEWSPSGCGPNGRCLLTCLTRCSNLYVYCPPSSLEINWKVVMSVSTMYKALLEKVDYNIADITNITTDLSTSIPPTNDPSASDPSTSIPPTNDPSASVPSTSVPSTSVPSASVPSTSDPSASVPSTSVPSASGPPNSVPSTSVPSTSDPSSSDPPNSVPSTNVPSASDPSASVPLTNVPSTSVPSTSIQSTSAPSTSVPSTNVPSASVPSASDPSASVPSASVPSASDPSASVPSASVPSASDPSASIPSSSVPSTSLPSTAPQISIKTGYLKETKDLLQQRSLLCITAHAWLPVLITSHSREQRCMVLSVTVRAGYLILFSFNFNRSNRTSKLCPLSIIKLVSNDSCCPRHWPCLLKFFSHNQVHTLNISYTNGKMEFIQWHPDDDFTLECFKMPRPLISLWPFTDDIPINLVTWSNWDNGSTSRLCVFVKGNRIVLVPVEDLPTATQETPNYVVLNGLHNTSITGLSLLDNNCIITCSQDGVIQTMPIPALTLLMNSHVTKEGCHVTNDAVELSLASFKHPHSFHGLAISENSLYIAMALSYSSFNKLDYPSNFELYSILNHPNSNQPTEPRYKMSWDLYEYSRQNYSSPETVGETDLKQQWYIQQLISADDSNDFSNDTIDVTIMIQFAQEILTRFLVYKNMMNSNKHNLKITDLCELSLSNFCSLLTVYTNNTNDGIELVRQVQESVSEHLLGRLSECVEYCGICNTMIPYSCYHGDSCSNGHYWKRCILTQCLITSPHNGCCCSLCDSHTFSISCVQSDSWLSWLLQNVFRCPLCGGFFDSFVSIN